MRLYVVKDGLTVLSKSDLSKKSINAISEELGYKESQFHSVMLFDKPFGIEVICFIPLTKKPIYFLTTMETYELNNIIINQVINSIDWGMEYSGLNVEFILDEAKESRNWTIEFLEKVLERRILDIDQEVSTRFGYNLIIKDGILVNYKSSDSLNSWAKDLLELNRAMANGYLNEGLENHNGDKDKAFEYLNLQAECMSSLPGGVQNIFSSKYKTSTGWIDFFLILAIEYGHKFRLDDLNVRGGKHVIKMSFMNSNSVYRFASHTFYFEGEILFKIDKL